MIAMHEHVQDKIAAEIADVFGNLTDDIDIEYEKLSELRYTEMAIKETLRLFSPATGECAAVEKKRLSHLSCMEPTKVKGKHS